jgi:hypothetical protein
MNDATPNIVSIRLDFVGCFGNRPSARSGDWEPNQPMAAANAAEIA